VQTAHGETAKKIGDFLLKCNELVRQRAPFASLGEAQIAIPTDFNYVSYFDILRTQKPCTRAIADSMDGILSVPTFGPDINDASFTSSTHLAPYGTYKAGFFLNTTWTTLDECIKFCKSRKGAILAGPHGLALAVQYADCVLPACKLLVSLDKNDLKFPRKERILSAGKCVDRSWALSVHRGEFAPGTIFVLFFEEGETPIGM